MIYLATKNIGGINNKHGFYWHFFYDNGKTYLIEEYRNADMKTNFFINTTNSYTMHDFHKTTTISYKRKLPKKLYFIDKIEYLVNVLLCRIFDSI